MSFTATRNADLDTLVAVLRDNAARRVDAVVPASSLRSHRGQVVLRGVAPMLDDDGVTEVNGQYQPTAVWQEGVADKLGVPLAYLRRMHADAPDLYDANVNGWLAGRSRRAPDGTVIVEREPDGRAFLFRGYRGSSERTAVARALLSDRFAVMDDYDVLLAALAGVRDAGVDVDVEGCDLTDRRMYVRVACPQVVAEAPRLLAGYRSPFREGGFDRAGGLSLARGRALAAREGLGYGEGEEPVVWAGFVIGNSEVGAGAFTITPRLVIKVCRNGLTITQDAARRTHLGGRMEAGAIRWSADTERKELALVTAQARDAVASFLTPEYVAGALDRLTEAAEVPVKADRAADLVATVCRTAKFTPAEEQGILGHFLAGGAMTAGGVLGAVTSYAQTVEDADQAHALEGRAVRVLELAAREAARL